MSGVAVTVHRATHEIGGNCIEVAAPTGERILLDVGRPLDAPRNAEDLLPLSLDRSRPVSGVLISHPHQDHYGLLGETPAHWPVYSGAATAKLVHLTTGIFGPPLDRVFRTWTNGEPLAVGPFTITPYLTDHSAFDAHMLLVEVAGRRIFYSGDFRMHGRKAGLVDRLMASPPPAIDVLLMEGTNLGSDKPCMTEADLEADFVELFAATPGRVFVCWSAQNLDRTVTLFRACRKAGRTLVVDLYTAEVLELLAGYGKLPQPGWPGLKVVITRAFSRMYKRKGRAEFVERMAQHGMSAKALAKPGCTDVVMIRTSLIADFEAAGAAPSPDDRWSWSMWSGYLKTPDGARVKEWFEQGGAPACHIHTSGHASPADLKAFAAALDPKLMIPIHGIDWDAGHQGFPPIQRLVDGEAFHLA